MTDWLRLWHDMPTDPKWRVIARKSGQPIGIVIAIYNFLLVNASENATERGRTHNFSTEDVAAALDMEEGEIEAVLSAMQGKVIVGDRLTGWEKRQPKREDNSAERAKQWRERNRTQPNAAERSDSESEENINKPPISPPEDLNVPLVEANEPDVSPGAWKHINGSSSAAVADAVFERWFWPNYPERKGAKRPALLKFRAALKHENAEMILAGLGHYSRKRESDNHPEFTKHASTWLNQRCWEDENAEFEQCT